MHTLKSLYLFEYGELLHALLEVDELSAIVGVAIANECQVGQIEPTGTLELVHSPNPNRQFRLLADVCCFISTHKYGKSGGTAFLIRFR